jgi:hypothetical protein
MTSSDVTTALTKLGIAWARRANRAALLTGTLLFVVLFATYVASPIRTSEDSRWSIATTMSFIRGAAGDLSAYLPPSPDYASAGYALRTHENHTYTMYPIGASLLAVPAVILRVWKLTSVRRCPTGPRRQSLLSMARSQQLSFSSSFLFVSTTYELH